MRVFAADRLSGCFVESRLSRGDICFENDFGNGVRIHVVYPVPVLRGSAAAGEGPGRGSSRRGVQDQQGERWGNQCEKYDMEKELDEVEEDK